MNMRQYSTCPAGVLHAPAPEWEPWPPASRAGALSPPGAPAHTFQRCSYGRLLRRLLDLLSEIGLEAGLGNGGKLPLEVIDMLF